jgi:hypothetical protein
MLNASQLAQQYTSALACQMQSGVNSTAALLASAGASQSSISLSALQQQQHRHHNQHHHHQHPHASNTSPYIFLSASASSSDEVCGNGGSTGVANGKTATLSSPSALYFYNNNSTPTMYSTDFLRL